MDADSPDAPALLRRSARESAGRDGPSGQGEWPSVPPVRLCGIPRGGECDGADGRVGADRRGDGELFKSARREGGCDEGALMASVLAEALRCCLAEDGEADLRAGQGARGERVRRAAVFGCELRGARFGPRY